MISHGAVKLRDPLGTTRMGSAPALGFVFGEAAVQFGGRCWLIRALLRYRRSAFPDVGFWN